MKKIKIGYNHPLCKVLQAQGYSVRLSQDIVCAIFGRVKEALSNKEDVYLPIGNFKVIPDKRKRQRRIGIKGPCWMYTKKYKIVFEEANE